MRGEQDFKPVQGYEYLKGFLHHPMPSESSPFSSTFHFQRCCYDISDMHLMGFLGIELIIQLKFWRHVYIAAALMARPPLQCLMWPPRQCNNLWAIGRGLRRGGCHRRSARKFIQIWSNIVWQDGKPCSGPDIGEGASTILLILWSCVR